MIRNVRTLVIVGLFPLLQTCKVSESISATNLSQLYAYDSKENIKATYQVVNRQEARIQLLWRVDPSTLKAVTSQENDQECSFIITYRLFTTYSESLPLDSGKVILKSVNPRNPSKFEGSIDVELPSLRGYLLSITIRDLNSIHSQTEYVDVLNPAYFSRQSFLVYQSDGSLMYTPWVGRTDSLIVSAATGKSEPLMVRQFHREFPMAPAPFAVITPKPFDFKPDASSRLLAVDEFRHKLFVVREGIYFIGEDSLEKRGGAIFYFGPHYPQPRTVNDLLLPLRYITSNAEFSEIAQGENLKRNVDAYWLKLAGNADRARELIAQFYGRVERANELFHTYQEGWKSDRGMCYIVFGPPSIVHRTSGSEVWHYGVNDRNSALTLTFTRVANPFTTNDYRLNRSGALKGPWHRAVEFWRQGRVITYH